MRFLSLIGHFLHFLARLFWLSLLNTSDKVNKKNNITTSQTDMRDFVKQMITLEPNSMKRSISRDQCRNIASLEVGVHYWREGKQKDPENTVRVAAPAFAL